MSGVTHTVTVSKSRDGNQTGTITYPMRVCHDFVVKPTGELIVDAPAAAVADIQRHLANV